MSTVRLLVLGVVRAHGEAHGYAIHRELTTWRIDTWTAVKPPSIYHATKQLEREGLLKGTDRQNSPQGPGRVLYRITRAGDEEFLRLLEAALTNPDIEEFGVGIAFMRCLPRGRVEQLLRRQLAGTQAIDVELAEMKSAWPDASEPPHARHLLELWRGAFSATATWTAAMLERIAAGEFDFAGDDRVAD